MSEVSEKHGAPPLSPLGIGRVGSLRPHAAGSLCHSTINTARISLGERTYVRRDVIAATAWPGKMRLNGEEAGRRRGSPSGTVGAPLAVEARVRSAYYE